MVTLGFGFKTYLAYKWRLVTDLFAQLIVFFISRFVFLAETT